MANYTLHLGFDWNSSLIGAIWGGTITDYRFLQYALEIDPPAAPPAPAWFQFQVNDVLSVVMWNLSSDPPSNPDSLSLVLSMSFGVIDPTSGGPKTYLPKQVVGMGTSAILGDDKLEPYLKFRSVKSASGGISPWGPLASSYTAGSLTINDQPTYKLSFFLTVSRDKGTPSSFLSDPEVIVGSRGARG